MRHPIVLSVLAATALLASACGAPPSSSDSPASTSEALRPILPKVPDCTAPFQADICENLDGHEMCGCESESVLGCAQADEVCSGSLAAPAGMAGCTIGTHVAAPAIASFEADFWICPTGTALLEGYHEAPWRPICSCLGQPDDGWIYVVANAKFDHRSDAGPFLPSSGCEGACTIVPSSAY